jgi:DNA polymerase III delta prime subunit
VVREQIKEFSSTRAMNQHGFKLIILDEADAMTGAAQAALRRGEYLEIVSPLSFIFHAPSPLVSPQ